MNTRRNAARIHEEEISIAGAPPFGDQVPTLDKDVNMQQARSILLFEDMIK